VELRGYSLHDTGAYPEPSLSGRITWRVTQPWAEPEDDAPDSEEADDEG